MDGQEVPLNIYREGERLMGPYRRSIDLSLAAGAEGANAVYNNGVLIVMLPFAASPTRGTARGRRTRQTGRPRRSSPLHRHRSQK